MTAPDPIGCPPGILPIAWGGTGIGCTASYTSIQAAIDDPLVTAGWTVYVEAGTYNEQITIAKEGITVMGDPGNTTSAGAGPYPPILQGAGSGVGVLINAGGVTLVGFVIQGWDQAILVDVLVGKTAVNIQNNTIQGNVNGIQSVGGQGKPGTNANYNVFENNSGYDVINNGPSDNNVQNFNAENNYWGCPQGPVIAFKNPDNNNDWDYVVWAERDGNPNNFTIYDNNPFVNCYQLLFLHSLFPFHCIFPKTTCNTIAI